MKLRTQKMSKNFQKEGAKVKKNVALSDPMYLILFFTIVCLLVYYTIISCLLNEIFASVY